MILWHNPQVVTQSFKSGYMHNRLRMVVASFLTKDLGIDWRRGERFFAQHLNDYDLAANNGGWQWAVSTGCDKAGRACSLPSLRDARLL